MFALSTSKIRFPFGTMAIGHTIVQQLAGRTILLGKISDDGILAVAPLGAVHTRENTPMPVYDLAGVTVTAIARTLTEQQHLRVMTSNPFHFSLISQE